MEKQTVILRITASIDFSQETARWMQEIARSRSESALYDLWFLKEDGQTFLMEFRNMYGEMLTDEINGEVQTYFSERGVENDSLPKAEVVETYVGSLTIATVVVIGLAVGKTYEIIKGIADIPDVIDGLTKLKNTIAQKFKRKANAKTHELFEDQSIRNTLPPPPSNALDLKDFVIDARPLSALRPDEMKTHSLHLTAGISQNAFTLENRGSDDMRDIQIGLFVGKDKKNQWAFADAFVSSIGLLSAKQTISKRLRDFTHPMRGQLTITDVPAHVDCWVQDNYGIYLFNFYLAK